jgi:bacteriocin-like protein
MTLSIKTATLELSEDQLNHINGGGGLLDTAIGIAASVLGNAIYDAATGRDGGGFVFNVLRGLNPTLRGISEK